MRMSLKRKARPLRRYIGRKPHKILSNHCQPVSFSRCTVRNGDLYAMPVPRKSASSYAMSFAMEHDIPTDYFLHQLFCLSHQPGPLMLPNLAVSRGFICFSKGRLQSQRRANCSSLAANNRCSSQQTHEEIHKDAPCSIALDVIFDMLMTLYTRRRDVFSH